MDVFGNHCQGQGRRLRRMREKPRVGWEPWKTKRKKIVIEVLLQLPTIANSPASHMLRQVDRHYTFFSKSDFSVVWTKGLVFIAWPDVTKLLQNSPCRPGHIWHISRWESILGNADLFNRRVEIEIFLRCEERDVLQVIDQKIYGCYPNYMPEDWNFRFVSTLLQTSWFLKSFRRNWRRCYPLES